MQIKKPPRVAIYARVSTSEQNIDGQLSELKNYCIARSWDVAHEIVDHGYSGKSLQRPEFQRLLTLARRREIDCIVITRLDRAFRHLKSLVLTLEEWAALGITCISIREGLDYSTPNGKFFVQVLGALGEFERSIIVDRVKAGISAAQAKGTVLGRPQKHDPSRIIALRKQGLSYRQISKELNVPLGVISRAIAALKSGPSNEDSGEGKPSV